MDKNLIARLSSQTAKGDLILFTGAGFSLSASNGEGVGLPSVTELREALWKIAFPDDEFDPESSLADIYECALKTAGRRVEELLKRRLSVEGKSLPDSYRIWFSFPWRRHYTLNIDDLDEVVSSQFPVPRRIRSLSAISDSPLPETSDLLSIHLNGRLREFPRLTFSQRHYGERTASPDPWYAHLVADLSAHPVVFVGTNLYEPPLWQHIELRRSRTQRTRELRPGSYLVTPDLPRARQAVLQDFNIQWISMTQEEFVDQVLKSLGSDAKRGRDQIQLRLAPKSEELVIRAVAELVEEKSARPRGEFLLGYEPEWRDVRDGTAIKRDFESKLRARIEAESPRLILLAGTAGSGKSTTLMRLGLEYYAEGKAVHWLNPDHELFLWQITEAVEEAEAEVLLIDDVDRFGRATGDFLAKLATDGSAPVLIASMRTTKLDRLEIAGFIEDIPHIVYAIPHLEDDDIGSLLDALTSANRLGELKGLSREAQIATFQREAGRQLLVAMIQATSGEKFDEKIDEECSQLDKNQALIYAIVSVATSLRHYLTKDEILLAIGDYDNDSLNRVQRLLNQRLLIETQGNQIRVRHRVVADRAFDFFLKEGQVGQAVQSLLWAMATKVHCETARFARERKFLVQLLNHDFIMKCGDKDTARQAYEVVERLLDWDYHYYLQRGSFEVERGSVDLAKNFLDQARAMAPNDYMVQTEWAYMTLKRAAQNPGWPESAGRAEEAFFELEAAISQRGEIDPFPYHVYGSQGLSWYRRCLLGQTQKHILISTLRRVVKKGVRQHPKRAELKQLAHDVEKEYLMTAVSSGYDGSE